MAAAPAFAVLGLFNPVFAAPTPAPAAAVSDAASLNGGGVLQKRFLECNCSINPIHGVIAAAPTLALAPAPASGPYNRFKN
ncbi:hypothetical protein BGZ47_011183 [Haplosporangium gracile]|nr:hypothetical protein BGZ47_011183 [Haplosporangium gracile]